jgi:hypothetical protein
MTALKTGLNSHLHKITGIEKDYFSNLKQTELLELKTVLKDINNLLTLTMTIESVNWLCNYFDIDDPSRQLILKRIDEIKPNTGGYDIKISKPVKVIGEVKCIVPINNGDRFGSAQWDAILGDAIKLIKGKKTLPDTSEYYKFLFLIDIGIKSEHAINHLVKQSKIVTKDPFRTDRHQIKDTITIFNELKKDQLQIEKIYIKPIEININLDK